MKVTFLGCPCSGKTTVAAAVFSELKSLGMTAEFISEQARYYIAKQRIQHLGKPFTLVDTDQFEIMALQNEHIEIMVESTKEVGAIVVSDSSPINSLLYMTPQFRKCRDVLKITEKWNTDPGLVFLCEPVDIPNGIDPNRIHTKEFTLELAKQLPEVIREHTPELWKHVHTLSGSQQVRFSQALQTVLGTYLTGGS